MPITLQPTPRRIRRTRQNLMLGSRATLILPPDALPQVAEALREELGELIPGLDDRGGEADVALRFTRLSEEDEVLEEVPPAVRDQAIRLQVGPAGVEAASGSTAGWLQAARLLRGLREGEELVGVELLDWPGFPERQIDLPWAAGSISEAALRFCLALLATGRLNRPGLPEPAAAPERLRAIAEAARRAGVTVVEPAAHPAFRLVESPALFPAYSRLLPALRETALAAEAAGERMLVISLGALDSRTSLEALAYGVLFAGACAWNPQKADVKLFRRWYSVRRFGFDSRAPVQVVDELEAAAAELETPETALGPALEAEVPFEEARLAGLLRPQERIAGVGQKSAAALTAMAPLQPDTEERAAALQGLQWTAVRLKSLGRRLNTEERVRNLYRAAYAATASPKAVSDRLLNSADLLEAEAQALEEQRSEWHALWRRERLGEPDPATEALLRTQVEAMQTRAARMRELRDRYIQTGSLPAPTQEGLERDVTQLAAGLLATRLPPQPSPAWWPEGGAARLRVEVECAEPGAGMVWAVQVDFRSLAGESGAFNVRSARLLPLTEADEAGPERPCQLLRGGFAFVAESGRRAYFLYLDPQPGPDSGFREARASQSRSGVRLENRRMRLSISSEHGFVSGWRLLEPGLELLPPERELEEGTEPPAAEWRLRLLETGPLLVRARAEHPDGRIRQVDLGAGHTWAEISVNAPWTEFLLPDEQDLWSEGSAALFHENGAVVRFPLSENAAEVTETRWAAQHRPDGLTVAALLPDMPPPSHGYPAAVSRDGIRFWGRPHGGRVLLFAAHDAAPAAALARLLSAQRQTPQVRLGVVEERRVREF